MSMARIGLALQSVPKYWLYAVLFLCASVPLFFTITIPNKPVDASIDYFGNLMQLKEGDKILLASDWTNSTRGESAGAMEATLRILMRRGVKFVVYSTGDTQSPQVARDTIARISAEEVAAGGKPYKPFIDYVVTGFFPSGEGTATAINTNILTAFKGRKDVPPGELATDVYKSPVFDGIKSVKDFKFLIDITASNTTVTTLERIKKVPLMFAVSGVMVPETQNYYASGQIKGMVGGVKGVLDIETLMEIGVNNGGENNIESSKYEKIEPFKGKTNYGKGKAYYPTLNVCLLLLILSIFIGNLGMFLSRRAAK